jgi:hypothetical protein
MLSRTCASTVRAFAQDNPGHWPRRPNCRQEGDVTRSIKVGAGGLAVLALLAVAGLAPGDSARATVDHCYDYWRDWTPRDTRCTGHWTRLGHTFTGPVYGVDVPDNWQVIPPAPRVDGWNELRIPDAARDRPAVAVPGGSLVTVWVVWTVRVALAVVAAVWVLLVVRSLTARRRRAL